MNKIYYLIPLSMAIILLISSLYPKGKRRVRKTSLWNTIVQISQNKWIKKILYPPDHKEYKAMENKLKQSGFGHIKPEVFQTIKYLFPFIFTGIFVIIQYTNVLNTLANIEKFQEVANTIGDYEISTEVSIITTFGYCLLAYFIPDLILKLIILFRSTRGEKEAIKLQTYAVMMLKANRPVKQILTSLMERAVVFKEPLTVAVNSYSSNPEKSLDELKNRVAQPQFEKICISLIQALNNDKEISVHYLQSHRVLGRELNRINKQKKNMQKNIIGLLLLIFPLLAFALISFYPWLVYSLRQLNSVPM